MEERETETEPDTERWREGGREAEGGREGGGGGREDDFLEIPRGHSVADGLTRRCEETLSP